jgi:hypothetical protein
MEDRKFRFEAACGRFVNRVSGEEIPDDEPVILFRARDAKALPLLKFYQELCVDDHHKQAIQDRIDEFQDFMLANPGRMKEPGITHDILLNEGSGR